MAHKKQRRIKFKPKNVVAFSFWDNFDGKAFIKLIFWIVFVAAITVFAIIIMNERSGVLSYRHEIPFGCQDTTKVYYTITELRYAIKYGEIYSPLGLAQTYNQMVAWSDFKIINFSLMIFTNDMYMPAWSPQEVWLARWNNISLAYSYVFITLGIAYVALLFVIIINLYKLHENHKIKIYALSVEFTTTRVSYNSYLIKTITDFAITLTTVLALFNFTTTIIVVSYWLILYLFLFIASFFGENVKTHRKNAFYRSVHDLVPEKCYLHLLIGVLAFQNIYTIARVYFINSFAVNLDLFISVILPITSTTIVIVLFVKKLIDVKLGWLLKDMKNITARAGLFKSFLNMRKEYALNDLNFLEIIPLFLAKKLADNVISMEEAKPILWKTYRATTGIYREFDDQNRYRDYLLYILFFRIREERELDELLFNIGQIHGYNAKQRDLLEEQQRQKVLEKEKKKEEKSNPDQTNQKENVQETTGNESPTPIPIPPAPIIPTSKIYNKKDAGKDAAKANEDPLKKDHE